MSAIALIVFAERNPIMISLFSSLLSKENPVIATTRFIKLLEIPVTATSVSEVLRQHPDYPSLFAISDSLNQWNIRNACFQLKPESLAELPAPFMAHCIKKDGRFVVVTRVAGHRIKYTDPDKRYRLTTKPLHAFIKEWSGVVLVAQKNKQSGEENYRKRRYRELIRNIIVPASLSAFLLFACYTVFAGTPLPGNAAVLMVLLLLLKLSGAAISALLIWHEMGFPDGATRQFCSMRANFSCREVLQSGGARLFGRIHWSEAGFCYFAGSFLFVLVKPYHPAAIAILSWFNLLALPYTVFSVYYQGRIVRKWCPLCLMVQFLLINEFLLLYFIYWRTAGFGFPVDTFTADTPVEWLFPFVTAFFLPVIGYIVAKPLLQKAIAGERFRSELVRMKRNAEVFGELLKKQKRVDHNAEGLGIVLGNPQAKHTIVVVCNPYCSHCAKAHFAVNELLQRNSHLKFRIIFTATGNDSDPGTRVVRHFLSIYRENDRSRVLRALYDWYLSGTKNYEQFAGKHPLQNQRPETSMIKKMSRWCRDCAIDHTPTYFVDGYQLPEYYNLADLPFILSKQ